MLDTRTILTNIALVFNKEYKLKLKKDRNGLTWEPTFANVLYARGDPDDGRAPVEPREGFSTPINKRLTPSEWEYYEDLHRSIDGETHRSAIPELNGSKVLVVRDDFCREGDKIMVEGTLRKLGIIQNDDKVVIQSETDFSGSDKSP